jgi:hypothetical protein
MAETSNVTHAVKLASALLETPDQQHVRIVFEQSGFRCAA